MSDVDYTKIDAGVRNLVRRLNALPGVRTLQSCEGHKEEDGPRAGHIWLVMDDPYGFQCLAHVLERDQSIEQVSLLWGRESSRNSPVIEIVFYGVAHSLMEQSEEHIATFFEEYFGSEEITLRMPLSLDGRNRQLTITLPRPITVREHEAVAEYWRLCRPGLTGIAEGRALAEGESDG